MIGPHEGKELDLMLAGRKSLAVFHDALPPGGAIPEDIIPEKAFVPHVAAGTLHRFARDIPHAKTGDTIRYVCFTTPGEDWRAEFLLWLKEQLHGGHLSHSPAHDVIIGRLLGYSDDDINDFLNNT